jgi:formamidopyrimidine-DNA glycosylase
VDCVVRDHRLRRPVDEGALLDLVGARVVDVARRAKYLLVRTDRGHVIVVHLGMSGRVLIGDELGGLDKHDHVSWWFEPQDGPRFEVRLRDPRRFGLVLVIRESSLEDHELFAHLGPEPLTAEFSPATLAVAGRRGRRNVKALLMDARVVVGVGNIYASEALCRARVHPATLAGRMSSARWKRVHGACVEVLVEAVDAGGTTLRDYRDAEGNLGYFATALQVYGREGESCRRCGRPIRRRIDGGRSTFYCPGCQH